MKKQLGKFIFWLAGWQFSADEKILEKARHSVMIAAPHTSNWDFVFAIAAFWIMELDVKFFIKDTYTKPPLGFLFKKLGAVGVNRSKNNNLVEFAIQELKSKKPMVILVPAEGTRSWVKKWRMGFYRIATGAGVPISLGFLNYRDKIAGILEVVNPVGEEETDLKIIEDYYRNIPGKYPEKYNPKIF